MPTVNFIETASSASLSRYVDAFWHCRITQKGVIRLLPTACSELMYANTSFGREFVLIGPMTVSQLARVQAGDFFVGVRLRPGNKTLFQKEKFSFLRGTTIYAKTMSSSAAKAFEKDVASLDVVQEIQDKLQSLIALLINEKLIVRDTLVDQFILNADKHKGQLKVEDLARKLSISPRQFRRRFLEYTAFTPKEFLRLCRQGAAITELRQKRTSITEVAASHGYADHAHFSNELRKHTGVSPTNLDEELTLK